MRKRALVWGLYFGLLALVAFGCNAPTEPDNPNITIINNNTNNNGAGGGPNASPSPGQTGVVATVTINGFGQRCPAGVAPATGQKELRISCNLDVTVNPRRQDGSVIFDTSITGPEPERFDAVYGKDSVASFTISDDNPYNAELRGLSIGRIGLQARVKGVTSAVTEFTVVN